MKIELSVIQKQAMPTEHVIRLPRWFLNQPVQIGVFCEFAKTLGVDVIRVNRGDFRQSYVELRLPVIWTIEHNEYELKVIDEYGNYVFGGTYLTVRGGEYYASHISDDWLTEYQKYASQMSVIERIRSRLYFIL